MMPTTDAVSLPGSTEQGWNTHSKWTSCRADLERSVGVRQGTPGRRLRQTQTHPVWKLKKKLFQCCSWWELKFLPTDFWLLMHVGLVLVHPRCSSTFSVFLHTVWEIPNQPLTASMLFHENSETGFVCDYHATFCAKSHCLPQTMLMSQGPNVFLHLLRESFTVQQAHL